jgi:aldehyde:ferredoxin oxidoreductase
MGSILRDDIGSPGQVGQPVQPILKVDLTTGLSTEFRVPAGWEEALLGGASLAARILYPLLTAGLDPLSPPAPLLFLNGPLSGTAGPTTGRFVVCGKGVATGLWAESNIGGFWGPELRQAGFDGLLISGRADSPVYLWIDAGRVEVRPARHLWGKDVYEAQHLVKGELGRSGAQVVVIGPAGEHLVAFASIGSGNGRFAGRTGLGAVMGSKNLKAVAVHGTAVIPLARPQEYARLRSEANRALRQDNEARVLGEVGTAGAANYSEYLGAMPAKYYHQGTFSSVDKVSGANMTDTILASRSACHACVIACGRVVALQDGNRRKGPEYETICSFGPNLLIDDLAEITLLGELCDRLGMDTISTGNTIGLAIHLFEMGRITLDDTAGVTLRWGDAALVRELVRLTAQRQGIGEIVAQGARHLGMTFGAKQEAVQVNGLEAAYHDPRGVSGMALVYATSPRGACHNQSDYFTVDWGHVEESLGIKFYGRQAQAEKAANVARHQDWRTVYNSLVMCIFANVSPDMQVRLINAACGLDWSPSDMMRAGERGWNLKRAINNRLGLTRSNDRLPKVFLEPYKEGGSAGFGLDLAGMLYAYYEARGWDLETGRPSRQKLVELGLEEMAVDLWRQPE